MTFRCNICHHKKFKYSIDFGKQPIVHNLYNKLNTKYLKYNFKIVSCSICSHLQIEKPFDPNILYENYITFSSWKNNQHIDLLIKKMTSLFNLNFKSKIFEIGCNDGHMLRSMKKSGFKFLSGIEPTKDSFKFAKKQVKKIYNDFFTSKFVKKKKLKNYDLVYTRHVFEHITNLSDVLKGIHKMLKVNGKLLIEVPLHDAYLENLDYSFWEEHVNYFTKNSLYHVLQKNKFRVFHSETTLFAGTSIIIFAEKVDKKINTSLNFLNEDKRIKNYIDTFKVFKKRLNIFLKSSKSKPIIYGCGARSSNIVNFTEIASKVDFFIDDNKSKQNKYVPLCNLKVMKFKKSHIKNKRILLGVSSENEYKVLKKIKNLTKPNYIFSILPPSRLLPRFWKKMIDEKH